MKVWSPDGYIKAHLRKIWRWSPQRRDCLKCRYCRTCGKGAKKLYADHIVPVVDPARGFVDWNTYIDRLFNGKLQPLCWKCHKIKTNKENKIRKLKWKKSQN